MKNILLTFDVEEFDLPREHSIYLTTEQEFKISKQGLISILELLSKHKIIATFFTTATFAKTYPKLIKSISDKEHEIACHGYSHQDNYLDNKDFQKINKAKKEIEKIIKTKINSFRAPRFQIKKISHLAEFGFKYDSSIHPTFVPGRYIKLSEKRNIHKIGNITEIPPTTLPLFRIPISWIFFKNTPTFWHKLFTKINHLSSNYTMLLFHPWEFSDLRKILIPNYIKTKAKNKLEKYIIFCKKNKFKFTTISDFLNPEIS